MRSRTKHLLQLLSSTERRVWVSTFAFFALMTFVWAAAVPYFSGPDEPSHVARAWSVAHGEVLGRDANFGGVRIVKVPSFLSAERVSTDCYRIDPNTPAGCFSLFASDGQVETPTSAGAQFPLFYLPVGLPFLVADGGLGLILARWVSGAIAAAFVASAMVTARSSNSRRWLPPVLFLACPPMFIYIAGVTNPSGLEIAASVGMWISGLVLASEKTISKRLVLRFGVAVCTVLVARQLGPLWVAVALASLGLLAGRDRVRALAKSRSMQLCAVATAVVGLIWAGWMLLAHPLATESNASGSQMGATNILTTQLGRLTQVAEESIGVFGWLEVRVPVFTYAVWMSAVVGMLALCLMFGARRYAIGAIGLLFGTVLIQTAGEFRSVESIGFVWQGRYSLPMLVGVPLIAGVGLAAGRRLPTVSVLGKNFIGGFLWSALFLAFAQSVRRYSVGATGPIFFWKSEDWSPPVPAVLLLVVFGLAAAGWVLMSRPASDSISDYRDGASGGYEAEEPSPSSQ